MHAGEAICLLEGMMKYFERQGSRDPGLLAVTGKGFEACKVIADYIKVPLPEGEQSVIWQQYIQGLASTAAPKPTVADCFNGPAPAPQVYKGAPAPAPANRKAGDVTYAISTAREILDKLDDIEDRPDLNENAMDFVKSVRAKTQSVLEQAEGKNFVTDKQLQMLENMNEAAEKWRR